MKSYLPQCLHICTILNILNILFPSIPHFSKIRLKTQPGFTQWVNPGRDGHFEPCFHVIKFDSNGKTILGMKVPLNNRENLPFAYAKTKLQSSCAITVQLISTFVFATYMVQFLAFLNPKFLAIFCGWTARSVSDMVGNPKNRFS